MSLPPDQTPGDPTHFADAGGLVYRQILVGTGGAAHSQVAVARAAALARQFGATLHVVTVIPQAGSPLMTAAAAFPGAELYEVPGKLEDYHRREQHLQQTVADLRGQGLPVQEHLLRALKPAEAILSLVAEARIDLIVLGRKHKSAWSAALAGSVSDMVSHASPVDVLIAR